MFTTCTVNRKKLSTAQSNRLSGEFGESLLACYILCIDFWLCSVHKTWEIQISGRVKHPIKQIAFILVWMPVTAKKFHDG